jgi:asparagine synthase (glutamine-hydrolysing)
MAHGLEARVPFLDLSLVRYVARLPVALLEPGPGRPEKWLLREACRGLLPPAVLERKKMKFSEGAGSSEILAERAKTLISEPEFERERVRHPELALRSREEFLYFRLWKEATGGAVPSALVGRTADRAAASEA